MPFGDVQITDLDFAGDAVILSETVKALTEALERLGKKVEFMGPRVSKIKAFGDIVKLPLSQSL